jgi:hypothetical protein
MNITKTLGSLASFALPGNATYSSLSNLSALSSGIGYKTIAAVAATILLTKFGPAIVDRSREVGGRLWDLARLNARMIDHLRVAGFFTPENIWAFLEKPMYAGRITQGFARLDRNDLLNQENIEALLAYPEFAHEIADGLVLLEWNGLLTPENRAELLAHPEFAHEIANGLFQLQFAGILTRENQAEILGHPKYAHKIALGLERFHRARILTPENRAELRAHPEVAFEIACGLACLHGAQLLTPENRAAFLKRPECAGDLSELFRVLPGVQLLNQETLSHLRQESAKYVKTIRKGFEDLTEVDLWSKKNCEVLLRGDKKHAGAIIDRLCQLRDSLFEVRYTEIRIPQSQFDKIVDDIMNEEWREPIFAAHALVLRNRKSPTRYLPLGICAHIASFLCPVYRYAPPFKERVYNILKRHLREEGPPVPQRISNMIQGYFNSNPQILLRQAITEYLFHNRTFRRDCRK